MVRQALPRQFLGAPDWTGREVKSALCYLSKVMNRCFKTNRQGGKTAWNLLFAFIILFWPMLSLAGKPQYEGGELCSDVFPEESIYDEDETKKTAIYTYLDAPHDYLSAGIENIIASFDQFFANEQFYRYTNRSFVQLSLDGLFEEGGKISGAGRFRAKVDLPGTTRRFKLLFDTDPLEKQSTVKRSVDDPTTVGVTNKDYYASLQRKRGLGAGWSIRPELGLRLAWPLDPFAKLLITKDLPLDATWKLRVDENIYWYKGSGYGSDTSMQFDHHLGDGNLFRSVTFARYTEENPYFSLSQVFTFYQTIAPRHKMSYQWGVYADTEDHLQTSSYLYMLRYRLQLYRNWLFFEVRPRVWIPRDKRWNREYSLLFRFDMIFGGKYTH